MQHIGDEKARFWLQIRLGVVATLFAIGFVAVVGRVYYLQTVEADALEERTSHQWNQEVTRQARRGDIRDRHGVELAISVEVPSIFVRPRSITDARREAARVAQVLDMDEQRLIEIFESDRNFVWLQRQAHPDTARALEELEIAGIGTEVEYKRYYPMRELAGQLLGFVGIDGEGLEGLERQYNKELAGGTYHLRVTRDARGRPMLLSDTPEFGKFEGNSLHLTIDQEIQRTAEQAVKRQVEKNEAQAGVAIVLDVDTGDVLAMANYPTFDPNRFSRHSSSDWRLRAVTDVFEPGSVFKPFVMAAALQEGATTLDTKYDLEGGRMQIGRHWIRDIMRRDELTAAELMQTSSNVGSYKLAQEIGREKFYDYIRAFGFGTPTGIGLRGERSGVVWPHEQWAEISFANISFGQGLSTTPMQVATAVAALANGGRLLEPRIVDEIRDRRGEVVYRNEPTMVRQVISPEVAEQMAWALSLVTLPAGTGTAGALEHYTVAAKTGTAQQVDPETRAYSQDHWVAGFVGFAPAEAPEIAVAVFIDRPDGETRYGGAVAGPAFAEIAGEALARRGVLPIPADQRFQLGDEPPAPLQANVSPPAADNVVVLPTMRVFDRDSQRLSGEGKVPNFQSLTLRQALEQANEIGLVPQINGWGRVTDQVPSPGTPIEEVEQLVLVMSPQTERQWVADEPGLAGSLEEE